MRIGPFHITRLRRRKVERRYELPWDVLTMEHLSEPARAVIARCARSAAKDYLTEKGPAFLHDNIGIIWCVNAALCPPGTPHPHLTTREGPPA